MLSDHKGNFALFRSDPIRVVRKFYLGTPNNPLRPCGPQGSSDKEEAQRLTLFESAK
jgi:hypothetical protein